MIIAYHLWGHVAVCQKYISIIFKLPSKEGKFDSKRFKKKTSRATVHVNHKWPDPDHNAERSHRKQMEEQTPDASTSMCWRRVWWFSSSSCWGPSASWSTVSYSPTRSVNSRRRRTPDSVSFSNPNIKVFLYFTSAFFVRKNHEMPISDENEPC